MYMLFTRFLQDFQPDPAILSNHRIVREDRPQLSLALLSLLGSIPALIIFAFKGFNLILLRILLASRTIQIKSYFPILPSYIKCF